MTPESLSALAMPAVVTLAGGFLLFDRRHDCFGAFLRGAKEGMRTCIGLLPTLCALLTAVSMLNASGAVARLASALAPAAEVIGVPSELLPLLLTRPFSGGASMSAFTDLLSRVGPDSLPGLCASVIFGSSDTVVYVITVYFSSVGVKKTRWAFPCALAITLFGVFFSCFLCRVCLNL